MYFKQLKDQETSTYTYILADETSKEAIIIDSVKGHVGEYTKILNKLNFKLKYSFDTHVHADHVTGAGLLRDELGAESVISEFADVDCVSKKVKDGEILKFGSYKIKVVNTPGHTPCHVSYLVEDRLFTGDSLFINGCGRTDFQGGSAELLWGSVVDVLFNLSPDTIVYPGHDYEMKCISTIQQEKDLNPRFKGQTKESFVELMSNLNLPFPKHIREAVPANKDCGIES